MIYTDDNDIVNIEYGHGSVVGVLGKHEHSGANTYSLISCDKREIGAPCNEMTDENLRDKSDLEWGALVRFHFHKVESLNILIEDLQEVRDGMISSEGMFKGEC